MPKKKQQSKFKKFISWFKPTSPAKGALLFAIAFAVIGGIYMAYKSFAAGWIHTAAQINGYAGAYIESDTRISKSDTRVWALPTGAYALTTFHYTSGSWEISPCASVRRIAGNTQEPLQITVGVKNKGGSSTRYIAYSPAYGKRCSDGALLFNAPETVTVTVQNLGKNLLFLANISESQ